MEVRWIFMNPTANLPRKVAAGPVNAGYSDNAGL